MTNKPTFSIKDIAEKLNISKTTVSFILNGKAKEKRISESLTQRVLQLVEKTGYKPNQIAQSLRTGKTKILGLMVEDISNPFFASVARHIEEKAHENGYKIIYCSAENNAARARGFLDMFQNLGVDGYIITPTNGLEKKIKSLVDDGKNLILFDRSMDVNADCVMANNEQGTYEGARHLLSEGFQNIAFITVDLRQPQMEQRIKGYSKAVGEACKKEIICRLSYRADNAYLHEIRNFIQKEKLVDAIIFATNYLGASGIEALAELKLKIPDDVAVVSFDDNVLFRIYNPTITAIAQPIEKMSEVIIDVLLEKLNSGSGEATGRKIVLPPQLIVRNSSIKPAR